MFNIFATKPVLRRLCLAAAMTAVAAVASCVREDQEITQLQETNKTELEFGTSVLTVEDEDKTRIENSINILWDKEDSISICEKIAASGQKGATFKAQGSGKSITFKGRAPKLDNYYALYPASAVKYWKTDGSSSVFTNLPPSQGAICNNADPSALLMCAKTTNTQMQLGFKVIVALVKFTIDSSSSEITAITINAPGQYLAGSSAVNTSYSIPSLAGTGAKTSSVTLSKQDGSTFEPGDYYIAVIPRTYSSISFTFTGKYGLSCTKSKTDVTFEAGKVYSAGIIPSLFKDKNVEKYEYSSTLSPSAAFDVHVEGVEQFVYPSGTIETYDEQVHVCAFGCKDEVLVSVSPKSGTVASATVRPKSIDFSSNFADNTLTLKMKPCDRAIVEFNNDNKHPLFLFANEFEQRPASATHYFKAGQVYDREQITLKTGESIYVEGGAVVHTTVRSNRADSISIKGAGIIDASEISAYSIHLRRFKNLEISGICTIGRDASIYWLATGDGLSLHNTKGIALFSRRNSSGNENDALDLIGCCNASVTKGFSYTHDDCCIVKANVTNAGSIYEGPSKNITVDDFISAYRDSGHGCGIGYSCFDEVSNVTFRNIYVPYDCPPRVSYSKKGQLSVHNTGSGTVSDITFENVHLEQASKGQAFFLSIFKYLDYDYGKTGYVPGKIQNIKFKNIYLDAAPEYGNYLIGYDDSDHKITGVSFENLYFGNQKILNRTDARFTDGTMGGYDRTRFKNSDEPNFK